MSAGGRGGRAPPDSPFDSVGVSAVDRRVELVPHDSGWASLAEVQIRELMHHLDQVVEAVHHVGSTAVPGLSAKPIVDLVAVVSSLDAFDRRRKDVEGLGFVWRGEHGFPGRRYCIKADRMTGRRLLHLHCYANGDPAIERYLAFRDLLRRRPDLALAYDGEKRRCQALHPDEPSAYHACKSDWIARTEAEALEARRTGQI